MRILRIAVLVYLGVALVIFAIQDSLIFPGASTQGQRDAILTQGHGYELLSLHTAGGTPIAALFGKALQSDGQPLADVRHRPTVIFFYGNGSCMAHSTDVFNHVRRLGVNIIIPEFEGYGMSAGKPSEKGCYAAADTAYDYVLSRGDIDAKKIVPVGWSLGAAAAMDLASRRPVAGLVTISAFTSLRDMAHQTIPWLPTSLLLKYRFDNVGKLAGISCPILIIHGIG
ncbi:MAG: alpha/beta hydrolase [Tepidisphaeraceae bacterium]|jgi:pimeloyl-ACP methyl ester carboxylesterase